MEGNFHFAELMLSFSFYEQYKANVSLTSSDRLNVWLVIPFIGLFVNGLDYGFYLLDC
jgi:hypothetical protein